MHSSAPFLTRSLCSTANHSCRTVCARGWKVERWLQGAVGGREAAQPLWQQHPSVLAEISLMQRMNKCKEPKCTFALYRQTHKAKFLCGAATDPGCLPTSLREDTHLPPTFCSKMEGGSFYPGQTGRFHLRIRTKKLQDFVESNY